MALHGGGTPQFVILQGGRTYAGCGISRKYVVTNHFRSYMQVKNSKNQRFYVFTG